MNIAAGALLLLVIIFVIVIVISMLRASRSFAPWIPSTTRMARRALDFIQPRSGLRFIDLGCGDGRIVRYAYNHYRLDATGVEISLLPYWIAKIYALAYHNKPVTIIRKDLFTVPLNTFDIVYLYGLPEALNISLKPKLERELRTGSYVISYNFSIQGWKPIQEFHEAWRNLYIYKI